LTYALLIFTVIGALRIGAFIEGRGMTKVVGNNDGQGGRNDTYKIGTRKNVKRSEAVK